MENDSQRGLFDARPSVEQRETAHARTTDPGTSHEAAESVNVTALEAIVLGALREYGRGTIEDVTRWTNLSMVSVSPRFKPLATKGKIRDTGEKALNSSGRRAIIWEHC